MLRPTVDPLVTSPGWKWTPALTLLELVNRSLLRLARFCVGGPDGQVESHIVLVFVPPYAVVFPPYTVAWAVPAMATAVVAAPAVAAAAFMIRFSRWLIALSPISKCHRVRCRPEGAEFAVFEELLVRVPTTCRRRCPGSRCRRR